MRLALLLLLFFGSGACGLTYQVLWLRHLSLVFGVTVYAASTVLAAFMAGLAIGSALAGRLIARCSRPLRLFAAAEILIGLSALATPAALDAATALYARLHHLTPESLAILTLARLLTSLIVLLPPTILMGLTLPVLSASSLVRGSRFGPRVGALYAVNTAGAVAGTVATGFYLIGAIGMWRTFGLGAGLNVLIGLAALALDRTAAGTGEPAAAGPGAAGPPAHASPARTGRARIAVLVVMSGFAALALEVVWFRTLVQYLAATTYAFSTMLAMMLGGLAAGAAVAARLLRRERDWRRWLAAVQAAAGCAVLGSAIFLGWSYGQGWRTGAEIQASAAAIFPAALLMGMALPVAIRLAASPEPGDTPPVVADRVGRLYALNVCGAIAGALLGGFIVLPALGARLSLAAMAGVYAASALLFAGSIARRWRLPSIGIAALAFGTLAAAVPDPFAAAHARRHGTGTREIWRDEGVQTAVSVHDGDQMRALYLDGLHQANDSPDMVRLHRAIGHLPVVLHPSPRTALVVGLGGGATAGAVSRHVNTRVQVVELSDGVRRAAALFAHVNYRVLEAPNVGLRVDDARNFLLLSGERFDVITADIIQPIHAGAGNLYSREYFRLVRRALNPGGLALQWIGHREAAHYRLIMRTFLDVFPDATLWLDGALLVGSLEPLRVDGSTLAAERAHPDTAAALDAVGLTSFDDLLSWYTGGPSEMRAYVESGPILTDDRPLVEYHRSLPREATLVDLSALRGDVADVRR